MTRFGSDLSTWFWNPDVWLPPNVDWDTFKEEKVINSTVVIKPENFAKFSDLWFALPFGIAFIFVRFFVENYVLKPIGQSLGLSDNPRKKPRENAALEAHFHSNRKLLKGEASTLSQKSGLTEIQVSTEFYEMKVLMKSLISRWRDGTGTGGEPRFPPG